MNKTFDINRFISYTIRNLYIARKQFLGIIGILIGLFLLAIILMPIEEGTFGSLFIGFMRFASVVIVIVSPSIMEEKLVKNKAIFSYILPVSIFERYLYLILKYVLIIPILSFGLSYILKESLHLFTTESFIFLLTSKSLDFNPFTIDFFITTLAAQSFFMLGYFYFKQYAYFKTAAILIVFLLAVVFVGSMASGFKKSGLDITMFLNSTSYTKQWLGETPKAIELCNIIIKSIFPFGIWFATYFKIRETEI